MTLTKLEIISILILLGLGGYATYLGYLDSDKNGLSIGMKWKVRILGPSLLCIALYALARSCST
jgi:hypothetical protein